MYTHAYKKLQEVSYCTAQRNNVNVQHLKKNTLTINIYSRQRVYLQWPYSIGFSAHEQTTTQGTLLFPASGCTKEVGGGEGTPPLLPAFCSSNGR
jgi:hypothetical protein